MEDKNHIIVDSSSIVYSAFYSYGVLSYQGKPTGIIYGFLSKILSLSKEFDSSKFYFCWDSDKSYRKEIYKEYKSNRRKNLTEDEKIAYMYKNEQSKELSGSILKTIGFMNNFQQDGFEADDLLAILAKKLCKKKKKVLLITSDSDLFQCLDYCDIINTISKKRITKKKFVDKYKIQPKDWILCKAIGGCVSDNVKGIVGASDPAKSESSKAIKYVIGELKKGVIFDRIESSEGQKLIETNLDLVTCPFPQKRIAKTILKRNKFKKKKFLKVFEKYNFKRFLEPENFDFWEKFIK